MPVVLNEIKQAETILEKGEVGNKPTSTLFLLSKYYRQKLKLSEKKTSEKLNEFMNSNYKNYNPVLWEDIIEDISRKGKKYELRNVEHIGITQSELDIIESAKTKNHKKLLFTMLCFAKLYNITSPNNNNWINADIKEIFKTARVIVKHREDKFLLLNDLESNGYISFSSKNDNLNMKINFIDNTNNPILYITDFRELGYEYLNYIKNGTFTRCKVWDRLIRKASKNIQYCAECKEDKKLEKYIKYNQKRNTTTFLNS